MTLQEFIDKDFGGNVSNFAKSYGVTRQTVYNLLAGKTKPQHELCESLKRKGVRFDGKPVTLKKLRTLWNGKIVEVRGQSLRLFDGWSDYCKNRGDRPFERGSWLSALINSSDILTRELGPAAMYFAKPTETRREILEALIKKRTCTEIRQLVPPEELNPVSEKVEKEIMERLRKSV